MQIERQATGCARVGTHVLTELYDGRIAQQRCGYGGIFRRHDGTARHDRYAVGAEYRQRLVLHRCEASCTADRGQDVTHRIAIRRHGEHRAVWQLACRRAVAAVLNQVQEPPHRMLGRRKHRHACLGQATPRRRATRLAHGTDQEGHFHPVTTFGEGGDRAHARHQMAHGPDQHAAHAWSAGGGCQRRQTLGNPRLHMNDVGCELQSHCAAPHPRPSDRQ